MKEIPEDRMFQLWGYVVSHGHLMLRSPATHEFPTNVDIMFAGVEYISVARHLGNVTFADPTSAEIEHVQAILRPRHEIDKIFVLASQEKRFLIAASWVKVEENDLGMFDAPFLDFRE